tara:strand:+ start:2343 stop:2627 length:285 start_codon:yes stop_codon:yes gene_type:complete
MSEIVEVKPARSQSLKQAQKNYMLKIKNDPEKREKMLVKRRTAYENKKNKNKEDKESIAILKSDIQKQNTKISTLESQKAELLKIRNLIDTLLN